MTERRKEKLLKVLRARQPDLTVVMQDIHDPHNVSAMLRSADAVGVMEVQLVYTSEEFPRLGKKSSASASKWIAKRKFNSIPQCYDALRKEGFRIYATHLGKDSVPLYDVDLTGKTALVFGNEHRGVDDQASDLADGNIYIPMMGMIASLNVSVACAVMLYEALRQRMRNGAYEGMKLPEATLSEHFELWTKKR